VFFVNRSLLCVGRSLLCIGHCEIISRLRLKYVVR